MTTTAKRPRGRSPSPTHVTRPVDLKDELRLHPHFERNLEPLVNDVCAQWLEIDPLITRIQETSKELRTYLKYEIDRIQLVLDRMEWETRCKPEDRVAMTEWLAQIKALSELSDPELASGSCEFLVNLRDALFDLQGKMRATEAAL